MIVQIYISSLILALIILPVLGWKWRINIRLAVTAAVIIGSITGFIVNRIASITPEMNFLALILIEFAIIILISTLAIIYRFYRDPERVPPQTEQVILSPADGKIIYISPVDKNTSLISTKGRRNFKLDDIAATGLLSGSNCLIGIEMNLLNVHVNRSPVGGKIIWQRHIHGRFLSLGKPEAEIINERVSIIVDNGSFRVGIVQIASRLVRQIVSYLKEGDTVHIGQRLGMIRFGSQVDVIIPEIKGLQIKVKVGDIVLAGISILAEYKQ